IPRTTRPAEQMSLRLVLMWIPPNNLSTSTRSRDPHDARDQRGEAVTARPHLRECARVAVLCNQGDVIATRVGVRRLCQPPHTGGVRVGKLCAFGVYWQCRAEGGECDRRRSGGSECREMLEHDASPSGLVC